MIQFKPPNEEIKSVNPVFEIMASFYNIEIDQKINKVESFAYLDYFTQMQKLNLNVVGNNLRFDMTSKTKEQIGYDDLSKKDQLIMLNYHMHDV